MPTILIIDDEPSIQHAFRRAFRNPKYTVRTASTAAQGLEAAHGPLDAVILDIHLPDESGLDILKRLQEAAPKTPIILITGHGTTDTAIEAMKLGAYDYVLKPLDVEQLRQMVDRAVEISSLMRVPAMLPDEKPATGPADVLIGRSPAMQEVYKAIGKVAPQDITVLIQGESGTGKELVARAIYHHSRRSAGPFLAINCAAIPETLLESELFGHEKGSFTGADRKRVGKFEQCSGGTLFLDEIGDMTPLTQTKVLRVLQEQRFERVGGNDIVETNARLIAATNRNLERLVTAGQFRGDLYYRLGVFTIKLPPLRERLDDLPLLVEHFTRLFAAELGKEIQQIAPDTLEALRRYSWPGNLRELQSVLKQALLNATGTVLVPDFLPPLTRSTDTEPAPGPLADWDRFIGDRLQEGSEDLYREAMGQMERHLLVRILRHTRGNQLQAAKTLGMTRARLRSKIRALGITIEPEVWSKADQDE